MAQLTREEMPAAGHYVRLKIGVDLAGKFAAGPVRCAVIHLAYLESVDLSDAVRAELAKVVAGSA